MVYLIWYRMVKSYPAHDLHLGMLIETHSEMQRAHGNDLNLIQSALTCTVSHSQHISWVIIVILTTLVAKNRLYGKTSRTQEWVFIPKILHNTEGFGCYGCLWGPKLEFSFWYPDDSMYCRECIQLIPPQWSKSQCVKVCEDQNRL